MSAAAEVLNVSQPSLTVAIQTIEAHLGKPLFLRGRGQPIRPTGFAFGFLERAEALLAQAAALENPKSEGSGRAFRLGCFADLAPEWLAPALKAMRAAVPDLQVIPEVADFETLAHRVALGRLDLAITYDLGLDASFERNALTRVRPRAFVAGDDPMAECDSVTLAMLEQRPLILFEEGLSIRHMLALFAAQGLRPVVAHRAASLEVMRSLAGNGEGVGISYSVPSGNRSYDGAVVVGVPISDAVAQEDIVAAYRADMAEIAPIAVVMEILREMRATALA